jgi:hypothetical protein
MNIKFRIAHAPECALMFTRLCALLVFAQPTWAQNPITYNFTGHVRSLNSGSSIFPGVGIGTPVQGLFTVDYGVTDTEPRLDFGVYQSSHVGFSGVIGGHAFASASAPFNAVNVDDGEPVPVPGDFVVFAVQPGMPTNLSRLELTFYDSSGQTIGGDALPGCAATFDAFPDLVLYAQSSSAFGQYVFDVAITPGSEGFAPVIVGASSNLSSCVGGSATFKVRAQGSEPLSYRWFFDGATPLIGETNAQLNLVNLETSQAGLYSVVVSNGFGSVTSAPARLVVFDACVAIHPYAGLSITGVVGHTYNVEYVTNLAATNWTVLASNTFSQSHWLFIDTNTPFDAKKFFRVRRVP